MRFQIFGRVCRTCGISRCISFKTERAFEPTAVAEASFPRSCRRLSAERLHCDLTAITIASCLQTGSRLLPTHGQCDRRIFRNTVRVQPMGKDSTDCWAELRSVLSVKCEFHNGRNIKSTRADGRQTIIWMDMNDRMVFEQFFKRYF